MRKKILVICLVFMVCISGCIKNKESTAKPNIQSQIKSEKADKDSAANAIKEYEFLDVKGNKYKAPLLESVPKHRYDYSKLETQAERYVYRDKNGNQVSKFGIDVSKYQKNIDWVRVKNAGVEFAMVRMGYRGYGAEGRLVLDAKFREHVEGAVSVGIEVGVYFFSQAITDQEAMEEAQFVLENIKEYPITYPVVFDTEAIEDPEARTMGISGTQFTNNSIIFCEAVKSAGYKPMIYANLKWYALNLQLERLVPYDKWYADYYKIPQYPYEFKMWQYSETGTVDGIEGNVDLNLCF